MAASEAKGREMKARELIRSFVMSIEKQLVEKYGPLLSLVDLSDLLKRSPDGLRIAMTGPSDFAKQWRKVRCKVGRRIYFRASDVAALIEAPSASNEG